MKIHALSASVLTVTALAAVPPAAAAAKAPAASNDFNGDGRRDFVVSDRRVPRAQAQGVHGRTTVIYGGAGRHRTQTLSPASLGLKGRNLNLGEAVASADFDRDGYADLAVTVFNHKRLVIVYGSRKGLSKRKALLPVDPTGSSGLVAGDFDGDRRPDLAFSSGTRVKLFTKIGKGGKPRSTSFALRNEGTVRPVAADFTGDGITDLVYGFAWPEIGPKYKSVLFRGSKAGLRPSTELDLTAVGAVAAGDVNGDGRADLVASTGFDHDEEGAKIRVAYGTAKGLAAPVIVPRVPRGEYLSISVRDLDGDGRAEAAIGISSRSSISDGGGVLLLRGTGKGLTAKGVQVITEATEGVPGTPEPDDHFGMPARLTDVTGDGKPDLVVVAAGEKPHGRLFIFRNVKGGISLKGVQVLRGEKLGGLGLNPHGGGWTVLA